MSYPRFQWIDVILLKWDWKVKTQKSAFIRVIRVIRDSDNTHAKNFTHPIDYAKWVGFPSRLTVFFSFQYSFKPSLPFFAAQVFKSSLSPT